MSGIVEKISDRYAEEIGSLPSIGMLTAFIIFLSAIFLVSDENLYWMPTIDQLFSKSIADIFDKDNGIIAKSSLGNIILAATCCITMKFLYKKIVKYILKKISRFKIVENYIYEADKIANDARLSTHKSNGEGESFITNELALQRKIFQRTHDYSFVLFSILYIALFNLGNIENVIIAVTCLMLLAFSEIYLIKIYLTRLFPAICIANAYTQKVAKFGDT